MNINHSTTSFVAFLLLALFFSFPVHAAEKKMLIAVATTKNAIEKYCNLPESAKAVPLATEKLPPEIKSRCLASLMLLKNALILGGIDPQFNFLQTPNVRREEDELIKGYAVISTHLFNKSAVDQPKYAQKIYISDAVLEDGQFEKGIFCLPGNHKVLNSRSLDDLKKAGKPLVGMHWTNDCQTLADLGIDNMEKGPTMESIFRMIKAGRADWVPLGFHNYSKDLSISSSGITLVPVKGLKIALKESRHFIVSRQHPDGKQIFDALQKGIRIMRESGLVSQLLTQGGFHCRATRNWKIINTENVIAEN